MSYADDRDTRKALREPFPKEQIGKLPATQKRPALDFVGHAAVTDRLNHAAPAWSYTVDERFDHDGQCWIRGTFTIDGISRIEYGDGKDPKEAIGNFLRRGAMRFGVAIDLWSREELSQPVEPVAVGPEGSARTRSHTADGKAGEDGEASAEGTRTQGATLASPDGSEVIVEDAASDPELGPETSDGAVMPGDAVSDAAGEARPTPDPVAASPALLSSQAKQLMRHAVDLRWNDADISAAVADAYPGLGAIGGLSQEQARELIRVWADLVKHTRPTKEQKDRLKALATPTDQARRAQVLFGADHIRNASDLTLAEAEALISDLEIERAAS